MDNLREGKPGGNQQITGTPNSASADVFRRRNMEMAPERTSKMYGADSEIISYCSNGDSICAAVTHYLPRLYQPGRHILGLSLKRAAYYPCEVEAASFNEFRDEPAMFLEHLPTCPSSRCSCPWLMND
jgi:hypothetical protein